MRDLVVLSREQFWDGIRVGVARHVEAVDQKREDKHGAKKEDGWSYHIEGACGEHALAIFLNIPWSRSVNTFRSLADVAGIEVRTRPYHTWDLIVRQDDKPERPYALVTGRNGRYRIRGWVWGHEARKDEWWRDRGDREEPCWWVPISALRGIETLPTEVKSDAA